MAKKNSPRPTACPRGFIDFEIVEGVEGSCLCVTGDAEAGSYRLAGPKPWGGGEVTKTFRVKIKELERELASIKDHQKKERA